MSRRLLQRTVACSWVGSMIGRRRKADIEPLSSVEEARLADILANGDLRRSHDAKPSDD